jgi:GT2 family glycosyltransferase
MGIRTAVAISKYVYRHPRKVARLLACGVSKDPILGSRTVVSLRQRMCRLASTAVSWQPSASETDYAQWVAVNDTLTNSDIVEMRSIAKSWAARPLVSILMPVCDTSESFLSAAIESVIHQTYENWELCIADDASSAPWVRQVLDRVVRMDPRIKVVFREQRGGIAAATNSALQMATGEWIGFLDHDDELVPHALFCVMDVVRTRPDTEFLYSDEDKLDINGQRCDAYFKPPFNLELLRSHNYLTHFAVFRGALLRRLGGLRAGFDGSQDYDLILRAIDSIPRESIVHIPHVLYHWRIHPASTASGVGAKSYAVEAGARALADHLSRRGICGQVEVTPFGYRMKYEPPSHAGLVSIIVPTRNQQAVLKPCIESILSSTEHIACEIIVMDNGSDEPPTLAYLASIAAHPRVRVFRDEQPFNYSRLNNRAVALARGEYLVLLNNDTEVISPDWLQTMLGIMSQPDVGAVGAKLLYSNGSVQHGGVIIGLGGVAGHAHLHRARSEGGYFGRAQLQQEFGAVTGACLMVRKRDYEAVGGLDETNLAIAFNDVDLCLKLRALGRRIVWTPFAELFHHESLSRGKEDTPEKQRRFADEVRFMRSRWHEDLVRGDPGYNPNLSLRNRDFALAGSPRVGKPWK